MVSFVGVFKVVQLFHVVHIAGLSSPALYWVLSGDDFSLDISNREEPKIVCVGNDPSNQATYGSAMALIFGTLFKLINSRGNLKSAILLDEAPTVVIKGLDTLIATARSNEVAVVLGGQDKTQFVRDYGEKYANVIFNTVGNIISGQVNGRTAEEMSKMFGREFREKRSQTVSDDNESLQISFAQEELMPVSKIETLSQGTFFGKVADDFDAKIDRKLFCGEIVVDLEKEKERKKSSRPLPQMTSFGEERIWQSIREGELGKAAMRSLATDILNRKGIHDSITDSDISKVLEGISEREIREYLKTFGETYIDLTVKRAVEDNYQKIRRDIQSIFEAHGITDDGEGDDAGQSQPARSGRRCAVYRVAGLRRRGRGVDVAAASHFTSHMVVQQAFFELRWLHGVLTVGAKDYPMELKNNRLSSGSQTLGINARPGHRRLSSGAPRPARPVRQSR